MGEAVSAVRRHPAPTPLASGENRAATAGQRKLHVLVTVNAAWNIWNFRRPVIASLLAEGHEVTLLAPPDEWVEPLKAMGCRFVALEMDQKGIDPLRDLALLRRLRMVFRQIRPDAILSYTIKNNIYGAFAARSAGIPFIPNVSGLGTAFLSGGALQMIAEQLYRRAFGPLPIVLFQNDEDRDLFVTKQLVRSSQARLLPGSGIDLDHFTAAEYPDDEADPVFLMIARLLRDKGVHEFVDAAAIARRRHPRARFQLLGAVDAENRTAISRAQIDQWTQTHGIEYLGTCDDVRPHIAKAHCVVLPSYREGAPRTLIEAAAMARPLIATDVPGCRSVVEHGITGLLCEVRSAESLADACAAFLDLPQERRAAMGQAGREKMQREFDQALVVTAYSNAIRHAVPSSVTISEGHVA